MPRKNKSESKANLKKIQEWIKRIPSSYREQYRKARDGSLRNAVNSKCLDCTCWQREEVKHCTVEQCPLWELRPYQEK